MTNETTLLTREYLASKGWSAYRLARTLRTDDQSVSRVLHGKCLPSLPLARRYAAVLGLPLDGLKFIKETQS
jgi:transcriptional regulator with XRE-family HTH domain